MNRILWSLAGLLGVAVLGAAAQSPQTVLAGSSGLTMGLGIAYILVLILALWLGICPPANAQRASSALSFPVALFGLLLAFAGLFALGSLAHPWLLLALTAGFAGLWFIIAERGSLTLFAAAIAVFAGALCIGLEYASGTVSANMLIYLGLVPVMMIGGWLRARRIGLTKVAALEGDWPSFAKQIGLGLVLALPPALLNIAAGAHAGDHWVTELWEPWVALTPGIAEEAMARLVLLTASFGFLAGRRGGSTKSALAAAILVAAFAHGLAHVPISDLFGPAGGMMVLASILFGVPMGLIFVRFGFEAAVAYHFFIDFVRFFAAYLVN